MFSQKNLVLHFNFIRSPARRCARAWRTRPPARSTRFFSSGRLVGRAQLNIVPTESWRVYSRSRSEELGCARTLACGRPKERPPPQIDTEPLARNFLILIQRRLTAASLLSFAVVLGYYHIEHVDSPRLNVMLIS